MNNEPEILRPLLLTVLVGAAMTKRRTTLPLPATVIKTTTTTRRRIKQRKKYKLWRGLDALPVSENTRLIAGRRYRTAGLFEVGHCPLRSRLKLAAV
jgi:hypothetical protein